MPPPNSLRTEISRAAEQLAEAGIAAPLVDAELLAAFVLKIPRGQLIVHGGLTSEQRDRFTELVDQRRARIPIQHLTGRVGFRHLELFVGPGVFVPRPETEQLVEWGLQRLRRSQQSAKPIIVDLCAGSGAIALSLAYELPSAEVYAVESDEHALAWLDKNVAAWVTAGDQPVTIVRADATQSTTLAELHGDVDLVLSNPPYVPIESYVEPEAAVHDPAIALWAGDDGLAVIRKLIPRAGQLLKPGGWYGFEHGEQQASAAAALLVNDGHWQQISSRYDLAQRPRFTVARRS